jgi:hypothetical protein
MVWKARRRTDLNSNPQQGLARFLHVFRGEPREILSSKAFKNMTTTSSCSCREPSFSNLACYVMMTFIKYQR